MLRGMGEVAPPVTLAPTQTGCAPSPPWGAGLLTGNCDEGLARGSAG